MNIYLLVYLCNRKPGSHVHAMCVSTVREQPTSQQLSSCPPAVEPPGRDREKMNGFFFT